jgi:hypothetical protein
VLQTARLGPFALNWSLNHVVELYFGTALLLPRNNKVEDNTGNTITKYFVKFESSEDVPKGNPDEAAISRQRSEGLVSSCKTKWAGRSDQFNLTSSPSYSHARLTMSVPSVLALVNVNLNKSPPHKRRKRMSPFSLPTRRRRHLSGSTSLTSVRVVNGKVPEADLDTLATGALPLICHSEVIAVCDRHSGLLLPSRPLFRLHCSSSFTAMKGISDTIFFTHPVVFDNVLTGQVDVQEMMNWLYEWEEQECDVCSLEDFLAGCGGLSLLLGLIALKMETVYSNYLGILGSGMESADLRALDKELRFLGAYHQENKKHIDLEI